MAPAHIRVASVGTHLLKTASPLAGRGRLWVGQYTLAGADGAPGARQSIGAHRAECGGGYALFEFHHRYDDGFWRFVWGLIKQATTAVIAEQLFYLIRTFARRDMLPTA